MKTSVHLRFGWYVFCTTIALAGVAYCWNHDANLLFPFFIFLLSVRKAFGPSDEGWHEPDWEISDRALVIGFIVCLVALWVGGLTIAHYISPISPATHTPKYIIWIAISLMWILLIYRGYRWWQLQKREATTN